MRSLGTLLLAASIGLLGVIVWQGSLLLPGPIPQTTSVTLPVRATVKKGKTGFHGSAAKKSPLNPADSASSFPPDLKPRTTVVTPPLDVPDSGQMEIGTARSELRERYGVPTFAVSSVRDGSLVERYYYVEPERANLVVATLREGKLVEAQTVQ